MFIFIFIFTFYCICCSRAKASAPLVRWKSGVREAPIIDVKVALAKPEEIEQKTKLSGTITVPTKVITMLVE